MKYGILAGIVLALFIAGGAFYGGITFEKQKGAQATRQERPAFARQGGGGAANGMRGATIGTILSKDDHSLTIKLPDGGTKIVLLSQETKISKMTDGTVADLSKDTFVTVSGTTANDGPITASAIRIGGNEPRRSDQQKK